MLALRTPRLIRTQFSTRHVVCNIPYGPHAAHRLDIYPPLALSAAESGGTLSPVLVFVHGGAWSSGSKFLYKMVGRYFQTRGVAVIILGYDYYPRANTQGQIEQVIFTYAYAAQKLGCLPFFQFDALNSRRQITKAGVMRLFRYAWHCNGCICTWQSTVVTQRACFYVATAQALMWYRSLSCKKHLQWYSSIVSLLSIVPYFSHIFM